MEPKDRFLFSHETATGPYLKPDISNQYLTTLRSLRTILILLILNLRRVLNVVCFLLGNSPASEFYMPTFRNTLSILSSQAGSYTYPPVNSDAGEITQKKAYKIQNMSKV
jgi:hypothetical protein